MEKLREKGRVETLIKSLSRYSEKVLLVLGGQSDPDAVTVKTGFITDPLEAQEALKGLLQYHKFESDLERAVLLNVLHRLITSGAN